MPIGKNAIKRVANNGYSTVKTSAPDMENSEIVTKPEADKKLPKKANTAKKAASPKPAEKKTAPKAAEKKSAPAKKSAPKKKAAPVPQKEALKPEAPTEKSYANLGDALPVHLL